ncbi:choice-of-anchor I family protein [Vibrio sp. DW001]|uniref:choice-of-anchor I family protein n=1 Tax=Vibrio sp. DW001 TaxID=2912315 RepID=UPI0023B0600C|nr:choice-of-anchor I family protein [Vibrio sp. DW001]WED28621.1 choice-of-anchor I family protein [Vibrio sp. DW001]
MQFKNRFILALSMTLLAACTSTNSNNPKSSSKLGIQCKPHSRVENTEMAIKGLTLVGTHISNARFDKSAAEIVSYDNCTDSLYVVNAQAAQVDVLSLNQDAKPINNGVIDLQSAALHSGLNIGAANSVTTHGGLVAIAVENKTKQQNGIIALYRSDTLELINTYTAGALPDMVSFSKDGRYLASANEGEPNSDYSVDPEGSVTLVDLSDGPMNANVTQINFRAFNSENSRFNEVSETVRISAPNASVAQDLEPEFLTFADNGKLYVALQENNAIAVIDVANAEIDEIFGLGGKSWSNAQLDASNKDKKAGNFKSYPMLEGLYMPDSITSYTINGKTYILTANEGDGREYGFDTTQKNCDIKSYQWDEDDFSNTDKYDSAEGFCIAYVDEVRGKNLNIDENHPLSVALKDKTQLGRLKILNDKNISQGKAISFDETVYTYGARSFSIFSESGRLVYDSGDEFARIALRENGEYFNSTNDSNQSGDDRSDDKGSEPEAIETANINNRQYAFIGLERQGGIMIYDVSNPEKPTFNHYVNNRHYSEGVCTTIDDGNCDNGKYNVKAGDLGPESIKYFQRNGQHYLAVGNEVSGTTSVYRMEF